MNITNIRKVQAGNITRMLHQGGDYIVATVVCTFYSVDMQKYIISTMQLTRMQMQVLKKRQHLFSNLNISSQFSWVVSQQEVKSLKTSIILAMLCQDLCDKLRGIIMRAVCSRNTEETSKENISGEYGHGIAVILIMVDDEGDISHHKLRYVD